jgi:hypothetical protein
MPRRRGRPRGALSWAQNPVNLAAHHATVLMELWLAGASVIGARIMLSSLAGYPKYQVLIEECWRGRGNERLFTVPVKIKKKLCRLAIAHVMELRRAAALLQREQTEAARLRMQGYSDAQIAEILSRARREAAPPQVETSEVDRAVAVVNRRAPGLTLRRKAAERRRAADRM